MRGAGKAVITMSEAKVITCKAAVCWKVGDELKIEDIQVDPPSKNEVRVKIIATSLVSHSKKSILKEIGIG